ncbi:MAG: hypothetical protein RMM58_13905 [Chloroflexota bacterium]|nr:hypothetical protein [Dehalococcoidia bacterium]MDW8254966.1 hypothetical protein [Chloroflexota bacterium]
MEERFLPEVTGEQAAVRGEAEPLELADRLGPEATRTLVATIVRQFLADDQREVWRRRRERLLHFLNVVEQNLDYDLRARGLVDTAVREHRSLYRGR